MLDQLLPTIAETIISHVDLAVSQVNAVAATPAAADPDVVIEPVKAVSAARLVTSIVVGITA
jgi:hypothetical protein